MRRHRDRITLIYVVYLPVASGEVDQINLCYEGISQLVLEARKTGKLITIVGDFNSHITGYCRLTESDHGGRCLTKLCNTYGLKIHNKHEEWTCIRHTKNGHGNQTSNTSYTLIDWTIADLETEITNHKTLENMDYLSDHLPVMFLIKLNGKKNNTPLNRDQVLWNKIKQENKEEKFSKTITRKFDQLLENNDFNAGIVNEKIL